MTATLLLLSDLHARYRVVNAQIEHATGTLGREVEQAVVLGDFGMFGPDLHDHFRRDRQRFLRPVSFIEGNHEDHGDLPRLVRDYADVVTHLPRGTVQTFGPWRCLCLGGARYMDAWSTPRGCEITDGDIAACLAHRPVDVDLVLSHDCPAAIGVPHSPGCGHLGPPGVPALDRVADHLAPDRWFFGHHHRWFEGEHGGTRYLGLPQSWEGYALLHGNGEVERVEHPVPQPRRPRWWRVFGLD